MFQGGSHHQRPALLNTGQYIYAGFASHCVEYNFTGWIMGWDKGTGNLVEHFTTEGGPEPNTTPGGGIWMSGGGLATDGKGSMFFATGNGYSSQLDGTPVPGRQPPTALEEAAVNMKINDDGTLSVVDFFMPWEKKQLDGADKDLGTSPLELLQTDVFTCPNVKRMGIVTGKSGKTYILNLDNLGGYQEGANHLDAVPQVTQNENSVYAGAGVYPLEGGYVYINVIQYPTHVFKFSCDTNGNPVFTHVADTPEKAAYILGVGHGTTTSLNGQAGTGLLWVTDVEGYNLRVYNAVPQNGALQLIQTANIPGITKFTRAVFGDGRAYMGTTQGTVYCFGSPVNLPLTCTSPNDFGTVIINSTSAVKTIQCQANTNTQVTSIALKGNPNFKLSGLPALPFTVNQGQNISFQAAFAPRSPGPLSSDVILASTNGAAGYALSTPVTLKGVGDSLAPLLAVTPNTVSFSGVITGQGGATESIIFSNQGDGTLHIKGIDYSVVSETGPLTTPNMTANGTAQVGPFTFTNLPTSIPGGSQTTVNINFNPSTSGNFAVYVHVRSDGGTKVFDVVATSGTYPVAVLEFQSPDGSKWIPYTNNTPPFTFGNVFEQQTRTLKMRLTNNGSSSAASLSVTVSKPPFGLPGIVGSVNQVDLAEGTRLAAGQSATADLYCSVPKSQVNVDSYNGTAVWTMNTGDPNFGKQFIQFICSAVTEQVGPLNTNGSAVYRYDGCWKENNPGRQLKVQLYGNDPNNTVDKCITGCAAQNYAFSGVQYVNECWCGNVIPNQRSNETDCNYGCSGNANETCGGNGYFHDGSYISLFTNGFGGNGSTPATGPSSGPATVRSIANYKYTGCYTEATNGRALSDKGVATGDMTIENCAGNCTGFNYWGVEYGSECYCGNTLGAGSVKAPDTDCSMTCAGNSSEICGNGNRLSFYTLNGFNGSVPATSSSVVSPTSTGNSSITSSSASSSVISFSNSSSTSSIAPSQTTGPVAVPKAGSFALQGCYTEINNGRALSATSFANNSMTVEACAAFCSAYTYMGVEYSTECYCDNSIAAGSVSATMSDCSMTCGGNSKELCGGPSRFNFYKNGATVQNFTTSSSTPTSTSSASPTSTTGPATIQTAGTFSYTGCYSEATSGRALSANSTANGGMTVAQCASFCKGYTYMGIEYSSECYCDNSIAAGSAPASNGCSMTCSGDSTEICGGPNRLSFYTLTPTGPQTVQKAGNFAYQGCYSEATNTRALSAKNTAASTMTVEICAAFCSGYTYMGVEYSQECFCGNTINAGSVNAGSGCSMLCGGTSTEYCGGPNRLNFYQANATAISPSSSSSATVTSTTLAPSSSSSSSSPSSPSSTTSATSTPTPIIVRGNTNFTYTHCYLDSPGARTLPFEVLATDNMTVEYCLSNCYMYAYAALEYGRECWCGNQLASGTAQASKDSECGMTCPGNGTEYCGSGNRLTVYARNATLNGTAAHQRRDGHAKLHLGRMKRGWFGRFLG